RNTLRVEDVTVKLVELPKIPMVVGGKIFKTAEDIPMVEEVKVNLVDARGRIKPGSL
ncbi:hypothetical protein A2U01_0092896, partial [Trifolium medium]|nr:hypothetical protein [Trifolium medium]